MVALLLGACSAGVSQDAGTNAHSVAAPAKPTQTEDAKISADGWGVVRIGASQSEVEALLGSPDAQQDFPAMGSDPAVVFHDYLRKGIQVSYSKPDLKVNALFFFSGKGDHSDYTPFDGGIEKGLSWASTPEEVVAALGAPPNDYKSDDGGSEWRRLAYSDISFRFQNGSLETVAVGAEE